MMSQRDFSEVEPSGSASLGAASRALFVEKVRASNAACQAGDFSTAVGLYTDALTLDPANHILYSNRSAARLKQGQFAAALQDATRARELCPNWPKAYYRQGVALQCLGRHGEALAAFSSGLGVEPSSRQLLAALVEASLKSPLRTTLEPTFRQLEAMKLDQSPFVLISVVGQELLAAGQYQAAVTVLEAALRIGSCSLKLRGSVFSALSSAHWALSQLDAAINYMQQDLAVAKSLGDTAGECRAHGNLGAAYFSQGSYKDALTAHRYQLVLAMKCKDTQAAAAALTSLGHVYTAIGDYPNALASHKQCVQLVKQMGDRLQEAREIGNVGAVYLAMGEFDSAVDCHTQHLRLARRLGDQVEEARAYSNLGSSYHCRRNFTQAIAYHENVLRIAQNLGDRAIEARAYAGLGHAARCAGDYAQAKKWHERQLDVALAARDKVGEGRACSNLGIVYQLLGEHDAALKLHQAHLSIARQLQDKAGMGRAYGNIGNAYSAAGFYEQAIKYHKQELTISKEVHDRSSEASTHGNLAVAYQALGAHDMALFHYRAHLGIARELKDAAGEACALLNLGNCLSSRGEFAQAVPYYEQHLMLSQELGDVTAEAKACHFLGYAHYCLGNYREAVRYYDQDLSLAKDLQDKMNMGRAYCNLGLAHLALGNLETALECQKYFLAIAHMTQHLQGKFRALGNIGDVLIKMGDVEEAVKMYQRQLGFARQARDRSLEAAACGALGLARRLQRRLDAALGHHTQELTLRQEAGDAAGEARAHSHLGAVHMALGHYSHAARCYREQLERAQELQDCALEAQAYGNLGIAKLNMGHYEDAIGYLEQQLAILERVNTPTCQLDKARALGSLGDCYDALGDPDEAVKYHERHLAAALKLNNAREQERAYRGLGLSHKSVGNLQQALVCLEKRLVVSHELGVPEAKAQAYGELGALHISLNNLEQAVSCLEHQKNIAKELNNQIMEAEACHSLGVAHQALGEHSTAIRHHRAELELAHRLGLTHLQARACGGLGAAHAATGAHAEAARWHESRLRHATASGDTRGRAHSLADLGRAHLAMGACGSAVSYLRQALAATEGLADADEEARVRHRLGFALWASGELEEAKEQLHAALTVLESGNERHRDQKVIALYTSTQHALQRVLVELGRHPEALVVAERGRCRSLDALEKHSTTHQTNTELHHSQRNASEDSAKEHPEPWNPSSVEHILEVVNKQKAPILYYSLAAGRLYSWLLQPHKGILRFHQVSLVEQAEDGDNSLPDISPDDLQANTNSGKLERCIGEWSAWLKTAAERRDDEWPDDRPNTGLARIVNRNHLLNSSNYSLSSLFSVGSVGGSVAGSVASLQGSTRSSVHGPRKKQPSWQGPPCLSALYQMLLAPFEDLLPSSCNNNHASHGRRGCGGRRELIVAVEGALYACPWGALCAGADSEPLCERYALLATPALRPLKHQRHSRNKPHPEHGGSNNESGMRCLVVGGPRVGGSRWASHPALLKEAELVADMLRVTPLTDYQASKEAVLSQLTQAECIHFATHVCWKTPGIVLSPGEVVDSQAKRLLNSSNAADTSTENEEENTELPQTNEELPPASEFILTAAEIMNLKITARLVVISCAPSTSVLEDSEEPEAVSVAGDGVSRLCRALLAAGAQAILVTLWPAPQDTATKILYRALYSALLQGSRVAKALGDAMQTVRHTKHFAHPAYWSGCALLGANIRLSNKVALMGQALCELMAAPERCRDALRVCLHLVEKSLQRIVRGQKNAMYTTQKSIENKAGTATGWRELLMSVGFRFEPAANGIPSSVFFPQSDPEERLTQCSASLQALLGLSSTTLQALSKLISNGDVADDIIGVIRSIISQFTVKNSETDTIEVAVNVRLWRVNGCHELLASLGFDLAEVGQDEVMLRGKATNRRHIQFVLQALLALFDTQEAPRSLSLESSSSVESLASIDDGDLEPHSDGETPPATHRKENVTTVPPPPLPLGSCGGAFTMYVRNTGEVGRGEPDGRNAPPPAAAPPRYRGESDAAFTPSPPTTAPQRDVSLALAHQTKIRTLYTRRPPSDDSDWESSGHDTVLRRRPDPHQRYLDAFYELASAQPRRTEEDKEPQPSTSKRAPRPKMGTSRDSMAQVRHMSGELTPTISEVYHERNIGLGLAPPLAELLLAEDSKTEMRAASSSENLLLQNLEKLGLLGDVSENEERWCTTNASRPWLTAAPLETDVQSSDLTTAEIIERQSKFKKDEPMRKEENAYDLKPKEEAAGPSCIEKRSVSPFSELSRRDEGDGRSIADSHSSYKALVLNPRTPYLPEEGEAKPTEGGKTHPRVRRPLVPRTRPTYTTLDFPPNKNASEDSAKEHPEPWNPSSVEHILEVVNKQKAPILYYSLAAGRLYSWLLQPHKGILRFHQVSLVEQAEDGDNSLPDISPDDLQANTNSGKLERCIGEWSAWLKTAAERRDDEWPDDRPNTGLARIVNRNHLLNSSNYSLSSLFSVGSVGGSVAGSVASLQGSTRSSVHGPRKKQPSWQGPPCLSTLYQMLLAPFEDLLPASCNNNHASHGRRGCGGRRELIVAVEGALYACPWGALCAGADSEPLCERYALLATPALRPLKHQRHSRNKPHPEHGGSNNESGMRCLVVGGPRVGGSRWASHPALLKEAELVADMLRVTPLTDYQASKEAVLSQLTQAECIHFATHVCWKTPGIVLSPGEVVDSQAKRLLNSSNAADTSTENEEENTELPQTNEELPPASEFILTAAEIMNLKITARLVVISCAPSTSVLEDSEEPEAVSVAGDGVSRLCRALLAAGAQAILVTLWPAPQDTATKILYRALYSALLQGSRVAKALGDAMQTVRHTKHFAHPAYWSGCALLGANIRLSNKVALMGQALCELMAAPERCRDALRVCLHLVEKSLQRIVRGQKNAMYTTQKSIENKAGTATGWRELLMSVGFRFEPAANGIPSSVFFPQSDPEERLTQCSASLQALLGLSSTTLQALSKLISNGDVADDIIGVIRSVISQFTVKNSETDTIEVAVNVRLWRVNGCHELLASLGFDLAEVGQDEVMLRGKATNRRHIQFVLQALLALFDTQEAPRSLSLESSSSVESLASIDDGDLEPHSDGETPPTTHRKENVTTVPPPPLPLGSCGGAFTMYVRNTGEVGRGEPDGRNAPPPAAAPPRYRGESDAAFTPSPPTTAPQRDVSLALAHQTKIRTLYTRRPPSDDSDWESSGHDTVLRRRPDPHQRYLDAFYELASAQPRRTEEDKEPQPSTSKRAPRPKMGTSRDSMAQVRHMSGELTPTISEVYHERNIGLGLAPPLAELLLAEDSKTEMRAASSSENLLLQNLEKLGLLGDVSENEERWCTTNASRPWLTAAPLETDVQSSDLTTAEIIERQSKFKKDEPMRKEENAYDLKPKEEAAGPSCIEKRSVSPFSELSRRDEGDGRSIADSHSSYKALVLNPRTPYLPEEGEAKPTEGGKTHPRVRRPLVPRTRPTYTTLDFPPNK